jgi:hypothetical protein
VYWANEHPKFPGGGKMSQHLAKLKARRAARRAACLLARSRAAAAAQRSQAPAH